MQSSFHLRAASGSLPLHQALQLRLPHVSGILLLPAPYTASRKPTLPAPTLQLFPYQSHQSSSLHTRLFKVAGILIGHWRPLFTKDDRVWGPLQPVLRLTTAHKPHHSLAALNGLHFPSGTSWDLLHGPSHSDWVSPQVSITTPAPRPIAPRLPRTGLRQVPAGHQLPAARSRFSPSVSLGPGSSGSLFPLLSWDGGEQAFTSPPPPPIHLPARAIMEDSTAISSEPSRKSAMSPHSLSREEGVCQGHPIYLQNPYPPGDSVFGPHLLVTSWPSTGTRPPWAVQILPLRKLS